MIYRAVVSRVTADGVFVTIPELAGDQYEWGPLTASEGGTAPFIVADTTTVDLDLSGAAPPVLTAAVKANTIPLDNLSDVVITAVATGNLLRYNGTNWVNVTPAGASIALDDLTDVAISSPATGQLVRYNGSSWVNVSVLDLVAAATSTDELTVAVTGDTQKRLIVNGDGSLEWGSGSAIQDTNLYRPAADTLQTDDAFRSNRTATGDGALAAKISTDTTNRLLITADGKMSWGPGGSGAVDTNLYRSATDTLKTDDFFIAAGGLTVKSDEIDTASSASGTLLRHNGTKYVAVAEESVAQYPNAVGMQVTAFGPWSTTSATYVDVTGFSFSFTKNKAGTKVRLAAAGSWYSSSASASVNLAININGTDYEIWRNVATTIGNTRQTYAGFVYVSGLAAGTYTVKLRGKISGGFTFNMDTNDIGNMDAMEVK